MKKLILALLTAMTTIACTDNGTAPSPDSEFDKISEKAAAIWEHAGECVRSKCTPIGMFETLDTVTVVFYNTIHIDTVYTFVCREETFIDIGFKFNLTYSIRWDTIGLEYHGTSWNHIKEYFPECAG